MSQPIEKELQQRETILKATIEVFNEKGLKFTMDDIAKHIGMSKKTIYTIFSDKEALFFSMVDFIFDEIKESEKTVLEDNTLSTKEKISKILCVLPEGYNNVDLRQLYSLRDKFPKIYEKVEERLETGWETTISLIEEGIKEGSIRNDINIPIVKMMLEASIEQFFQRDILVRNDISYNQGLMEVVDIIMNGISK